MVTVCLLGMSCDSDVMVNGGDGDVALCAHMSWLVHTSGSSCTTAVAAASEVVSQLTTRASLCNGTGDELQHHAAPDALVYDNGHGNVGIVPSRSNAVLAPGPRFTVLPADWQASLLAAGYVPATGRDSNCLPQGPRQGLLMRLPRFYSRCCLAGKSDGEGLGLLREVGAFTCPVLYTSTRLVACRRGILPRWF